MYGVLGMFIYVQDPIEDEDGFDSDYPEAQEASQEDPLLLSEEPPPNNPKAVEIQDSQSQEPAPASPAPRTSVPPAASPAAETGGALSL